MSPFFQYARNWLVSWGRIRPGGVSSWSRLWFFQCNCSAWIRPGNLEPNRSCKVNTQEDEYITVWRRRKIFGNAWWNLTFRPLPLYGVEAWKVATIIILEALNLWLRRRTFKVSWTDHGHWWTGITESEVKNRINNHDVKKIWIFTTKFEGKKLKNTTD